MLPSKKAIYIFNCYNPHYQLYENAIEHLTNGLQYVTQAGSPYIILGDLNINSMDYSTGYKLRNARIIYNKERFQSSPMTTRDIWRLINSISKPTRDEQCFASTLAEANEINTYFSQVGTNIKHQIASSPNYSHIKHQTSSFQFELASEEDIIKATMRLPSWGAPGNDGINGFVLKVSLAVIYKQLTHLVNLSISTSTFPESFKIAIVVPIQKKSGASQPSEHRPVSLLTLLSKVLERVIYMQLYAFIEPILSKTQHGFRLGRSTESALILITDKILQNMDNRKISLLTLLDLSKAFDSIDHEILLKKLQLLGLAKSAEDWFKTYLKNRFQFVKINNLKSDIVEAPTGVPQGSILGPLLFLVCVNDLSSVVNHTKLIQFADDIQLLIDFYPSNPSDNEMAESKLNEDLKNIYEWCCENSLQINTTKSKVMMIGHPNVLHGNIPPNIEMNHQTLEYVSHSRNLGVTLDKNMTFKTHVSNVLRTASYRLANLGRLSSDIPSDVLKRIIETTVIGPAYYALPAWSSCNATLQQKLQRNVLNWSARIISGRRKFDHISDVVNKCNWLPVHKETVYRLAVTSYKAWNGNLGQELQSLFQETSHGKKTRLQNNINFILPSTRTDRGQHRFNYIGPKLLNSYTGILDLKLPEFKRLVRSDLANAK